MSISEKVAMRVIEKIDVLFPRFTIPQEQGKMAMLVRSWASVISRYRYPENIWLEAVDEFFAQADSFGSPPMPGDVVRCCRLAVERAERDPERAPALRAWRERLQDERDARLRGGA